MTQKIKTENNLRNNSWRNQTRNINL